MKLYYSAGACSFSPHIVLKEGGFNFTTEKVDLRAGKYSGGDFSKINPKGYVPVLQLDNGEVLTEGAAIVQYLADKKPEAKLMPAVGTMERFRCQEWLTYISTELHKGFGPLFYPTTPESEKVLAVEKLHKRISYLDSQLAGKDYLLGSAFSVADAYAFTVLSWAGHVKLDISGYKNVGAFMERMKKRPKVQEALKDEGLTH
jgi:glutathione S-transferase